MPRSSPNTAHTAFTPCPRMAGRLQKHANGKQKILSLAGEEEEGLYGRRVVEISQPLPIRGVCH